MVLVLNLFRRECVSGVPVFDFARAGFVATLFVDRDQLLAMRFLERCPAGFGYVDLFAKADDFEVAGWGPDADRRVAHLRTAISQASQNFVPQAV